MKIAALKLYYSYIIGGRGVIGVGRCSVVGVHLVVISGRWAGLNGDRLGPILSVPLVVYIAICFGCNWGVILRSLLIA